MSGVSGVPVERINASLLPKISKRKYRAKFYREFFAPLLVLVLLSSSITHAQSSEYDPNLDVYVDALWFRVHAPDCPTQAEISPTTGSHLGSGSANARLYMLQAFREDMIDGLCHKLNNREQAERNSAHKKRLATLQAFYLKALREDRSLIHLGERM